ncbi:MAG TPA: tRNA (adenosine(37)-N6)-dimethylallyltransferase MiaA [Pyrinomonadaceae bacterium]|jgi:tRNA dimethylallyltransferase|nr:tRNA (adenosine(37)-N6)-dimethylallyltransferase MiaA [Pyrinomonadaceae bacterium]
MSRRPVVAVVGPTASGKSALGIELALRFGGEIVNCDSVQVYREVEIATAKVPVEERRGVPHHLIDFVDPRANYTAGEWARAASRAVAEIEARGRLALVVGGTGFYLRALREPFFESPPTDESLRARLVRLRERRGAERLHRILGRLDRETAARLHARDWSRVQRALEVRLQTKRSITAQQPSRREPPAFAPRLRVFALRPPRAELYHRIDARAEGHFRAGLVAEVRALLARGVPAASNALGAHGYRRVVEHLRGERTLEDAVEQTKLDVRHYAKRQLTWFRREPGVEWVEGFGDAAAVQSRVAGRVAELIAESAPRGSEDGGAAVEG